MEEGVAEGEPETAKLLRRMFFVSAAVSPAGVVSIYGAALGYTPRYSRFLNRVIALRVCEGRAVWLGRLS